MARPQPRSPVPSTPKGRDAVRAPPLADEPDEPANQSTGIAADQYVPQLLGAGTPLMRSARYCTVPPSPEIMGAAWLITMPGTTGGV